MESRAKGEAVGILIVTGVNREMSVSETEKRQSYLRREPGEHGRFTAERGRSF